MATKIPKEQLDYDDSTITSSATPTPIGSRWRNKFTITALATNPTIAEPSGTAKDGNMILVRIKDDGTPRTISRNAIYRAIGITPQSVTVAGKTLYELYCYNSADTKWDILESRIEA